MSAELESEFSAALVAAALPPPVGLKAPAGADVAHRFGVYRNNVVAGLVNALGARFPVTKRVVGDEFFHAMARIYVAENLPRSPLLSQYGGSFPDFIAAFGPAAPVVFLADLAQLEFLRGEAFHAADAHPLAPEAFEALAADTLETSRLVLHPSVRLLSSRSPVVTIWRAHQDRNDDLRIAAWDAEDVLVARPALAVDVHLLPPGGHAFLTAAAKGASIACAASDAADADPRFDPGAMFALLIAARAVVAIRLS